MTMFFSIQNNLLINSTGIFILIIFLVKQKSSEQKNNKYKIKHKPDIGSIFSSIERKAGGLSLNEVPDFTLARFELNCLD